jgi:hypothetical protein
LFNLLTFILLLLLLVGLALSKNHKFFLFCCGALIPLITPGLNVGVNLFWYTLLGPLSLLLLVVTGLKLRFSGPKKIFFLFVAYVLFITIVWAALDYVFLQRYEDAVAAGLGWGQSYLKMPIQLFSFLSQMLIIFIIPSWAQCTGDVIAAFKGYFFGLLTSFIAGVMLLKVTGVGMIGREHGSFFSVADVLVDRIGGLSGEPKVFGAFLVVGICLLLSQYTWGVWKSRWILVLIGVLLIALFFTYSTSSWVAFILMIIAMTVFSQKKGILKFILPALIAVLIVAANTVPMINDIFENRVNVRLTNSEIGQHEAQKDNLVFDMAERSPWFIFTGFGFGGLDLAAQEYFSTAAKYQIHGAYLRTPTSSLNGPRLLGDVGFIGILLLVVAMWKWRRSLLVNKERGFALFTISCAISIILLPINAISAYLFLVGGILTHSKMRH